MILSYDDIFKEITASALYIGKSRQKPPATRFELEFEENQIRQSSIDLPIGNEFFRWLTQQDIGRDPGLSDKDRDVPFNLTDSEMADRLSSLAKDKTAGGFTEKTVLPPAGDGVFRLQPGDFVLVQVAQYIQLPEYLAGRVEGRTRYARVGLEVHSTAPTIWAGWAGHITLELKNVGPLVFLLTPGNRICQLVLERVLTPPSVRLESEY